MSLEKITKRNQIASRNIFSNFEKSEAVKMDKKELVEEHEHLVNVLKHGNKKQRTKEANKQNKELKEYKK